MIVPVKAKRSTSLACTASIPYPAAAREIPSPSSGSRLFALLLFRVLVIVDRNASFWMRLRNQVTYDLPFPVLPLEDAQMMDMPIRHFLARRRFLTGAYQFATK